MGRLGSAYVMLRGVLVLGAGALTALVLGFVGYRQLAGPNLDVVEAAYRSLQLFALDSSATQNVPWELETARFLAPAVVGYAAVLTVLSFTRDRIQMATTSLLAANHLVVVGSGTLGAALTRHAKRAGTSVVMVEQDPENKSLGRLRALGVSVIIGDARDKAILNLARVGRARDIIIMTGDDSVNLEILATCEKITDSGARIAMHVAIEDPVLWAQLHRVSFQRTTATRTVEFFNIADRIARELLAVGGRLAVSPWPRLAIAGSGATVDRVITDGLRAGTLDGAQMHVTLYGEARCRLPGMQVHEPWLFERASFSNGELSLSATNGRRPSATVDGPDQLPTLGIVCGVPGAEALSLAGLLAALLPPGSDVVAAVPTMTAREALERTNLNLTHTVLVAAEETVLSHTLVAESATELIARAKHEDHVRQMQLRGEDASTNTALVPWDELPASLQESNRHFADSVGTKLDELGAVLAPLTNAGPSRLDLPPSVLDELAHEEHERWMTDLQLDGWRPTSGQKDAVRKLHPLLVSWEQLPEQEREKDRDGIRALPELLARVGYEIRLSGAFDQPGPTAIRTRDPQNAPS